MGTAPAAAGCGRPAAPRADPPPAVVTYRQWKGQGKAGEEAVEEAVKCQQNTEETQWEARERQ